MKRYRKTNIEIPEDIEYIKAEEAETHQLKKFTYPIYLSIDTYIDVDKQGMWEWEDQTICESVRRDGNWYLDEIETFYGNFDISEKDILVVTGEEALNNLNEIIEPYIPTSWGRYRIKFDATLAYEISDIEYTYVEGSEDIEISDEFESKFNLRQSKIGANSIKVERE